MLTQPYLQQYKVQCHGNNIRSMDIANFNLDWFPSLFSFVPSSFSSPTLPLSQGQPWAPVHPSPGQQASHLHNIIHNLLNTLLPPLDAFWSPFYLSSLGLFLPPSFPLSQMDPMVYLNSTITARYIWLQGFHNAEIFSHDKKVLCQEQTEMMFQDAVDQ